MFTELTSVSILSFKTSLDCDQILHIKAAKTVFHQKSIRSCAVTPG